MTILTNITLICGHFVAVFSWYVKTHKRYGFRVGVLVIEAKALRAVALSAGHVLCFEVSKQNKESFVVICALTNRVMQAVQK